MASRFSIKTTTGYWIERTEKTLLKLVHGDGLSQELFQSYMAHAMVDRVCRRSDELEKTFLKNIKSFPITYR